MTARRCCGRRRDAGFTVLEALIAFVILVGVMTGMMELARGSFAVANSAARAQETVLAARSALARVGRDIELEAGVAEISDGAVRIIVQITPIARDALSADIDMDGAPDPFRVRVTASHRDGGAPVVLYSVATTPEEEL